MIHHPVSVTSHICILQNPFCNKRKGKKILNAIETALSRSAITYTLFKEVWPTGLDDFSDVWIIGGDGTLNYVLNAYPTILQPLVIFKGGTGNDFAWKLYGDASIEEQIEIALTAAVRKVDAASCNGRIYINSGGFGFDGEVLKSMKAIRFFGGHLGYLGIVLRKIMVFKEFLFCITTNMKNVQRKYLLVIVNNSSRTGGGFMVTPKATINDGLLDVVLCEPLPLLKRLRYLPVIEKGKHVDLPFIQYTQEKAITIQTDQKIFAQLDGELIEGDLFQIQVLPAYISFRY